MSDARKMDRQPVFEMHEPGRNFALYQAENVPVLFMDGIAGMASGPAVSHLEFFATIEHVQDADPALGIRENREVRLRVKMPTAQLLEGLANLVGIVQARLDELRTATDINTRAIAVQIERLKAMNVNTTG